MLDVVEITEVLGRADSGVSARPFRCRGEDGRLYYVKLGNSTVRGLQSELICGRLAQEIGLPVADFSLVKVSRSFFDKLPEEYSELRYGIGFGSLAAPIGAHEILHTEATDPSLGGILSELVAFDAWILNEDRKLGLSGGNPNILMVPSGDPSIMIIDHDSAFDTAFANASFRNSHLGRSFLARWIPVSARESWENKTKSATNKLDSIWRQIPDEWFFDNYGDPREGLNRDEIEFILRTPATDPSTFWERIAP